MALRVLIVNEDEDAGRLRYALRGTAVECLCPVLPKIERVVGHLDQVVHGPRAQYDAVVIESMDRTIAEWIACTVIDVVPWQTVYLIGKGPLAKECGTYGVIFVPNMLGVAAELKKIRPGQ